MLPSLTTRRPATTSPSSSPTRCSRSRPTRSPPCRPSSWPRAPAASRTSSTPTSSSTAAWSAACRGSRSAGRAPRRRVLLERPVRTAGVVDDDGEARSPRSPTGHRGARAAGGRGRAAEPVRPDHVRPAAPPTPHQLQQHLSLGLVIKVHAAYDEPFWREAGLSGTAFSPYELVHEAYDNTNHGDDAAAPSSGSSPTSTPTRSPRCRSEERRARILTSLASTTAPRPPSPSSTTRATGPPRSGPTAPTPRASTSAGSPGTAPTSARRSGPSASRRATSPDSASSTSTARSAWDREAAAEIAAVLPQPVSR